MKAFFSFIRLPTTALGLLLAAMSCGILFGPVVSESRRSGVRLHNPIGSWVESVQRRASQIQSALTKKLALLRDTKRVAEFSTTGSPPVAEVEANEFDDLIQEGVSNIYDDVSGPVDYWWRRPSWMARSTVRHIITPTRLSLALSRRRTVQLRKSLDSLATLSEALECSESIDAVDQVLSEPDVLHLVSSRDGVSEASLAQLFDQLGKSLHASYKSGGWFKSSTAPGMKTACTRDLSEFLGQPRNGTFLLSHERFEKARVLVRDPSDRTLALDRTASRIIILQCLCDARLRAITETERFLQERMDAGRFDAFYDNLLGPWDTMVVAWETRGTVKLDTALKDRFDRDVIAMKDVEDLCNRIRVHYIEEMNHAASRIFDELRKAPPETYPQVAALARRVELQLPGNVDLGADAFLRTQVLSGALELPLLAVDVGLIIAGIVGAPETGGLSLFATVLGVAHMLFDSTVQALAVVRNDVRITAIRCTTQSAVAAGIFGTDGLQATVGDAPLVLDTQQSQPGALANCDTEFVKNLEKYLEALTAR